LGETATFRSQWPVRVDSSLPPLCAQVPELKLEEDDVPFSAVPDFLRFDLRKPGLLGKLRPRPVLKKMLGEGSTFDSLAVPASVKPAVTGPDPVSVSGASLTAFRWYRLSRSTGPLFSAAATVIGGLLVAVGAAYLDSGAGQGLLIGGAVLTVLAAAVPVISTWRAPAE
jgi:hypothetical protein